MKIEACGIKQKVRCLYREKGEEIQVQGQSDQKGGRWKSELGYHKDNDAEDNGDQSAKKDPIVFPWCGGECEFCRSIAAASVVAKVTRDRLMRNLDRLYPQYGFSRNKGYATAEHIKAIHKFGPSPHHRFSFNPVRQCHLGFDDD